MQEALLLRLSLGMKGTFLLALVGFSALMAVGFATVWAYRVTSDLREQVEQRGESLTANLAGEAVRVAKESAARRESELDEELRNAANVEPEGPPPAA